MRTVPWSVLTLAVASLSVPAVAEHHESALMQEVEAIGDAVAAAMLEGDLDTMFSMYVDDAISLPNFSPRMDGVAAFRENHAAMTASGLKINDFDSQPTDVWEAGDHVIEIGTFAISLDMPGMPGIEDEGKYMTVYVRDSNGDLKIKAETWNTDMNPMEMGGEPPQAEQ